MGVDFGTGLLSFFTSRKRQHPEKQTAIRTPLDPDERAGICFRSPDQPYRLASFSPSLRLPASPVLRQFHLSRSSNFAFQSAVPDD